MAKPRTPNQKKAYAALKGRLNIYAYLVQTVYDTLNVEAAKLALSTGYAGEREFRWSDYPQTQKRIKIIQDRFCDEISGLIYSNTEKEWMESNIVQDMLAAKAMKSYHVESKGKKYQKLYHQTNLDALQAFQERVEGGMNLSSRVWNQSVAYRRELECAISAGVEKGMSAVTLSKRVSKYLVDFDQLKADYKERYGKAVDCLNCEYRSMRLARTEINMAYRTAEQKRWQQFDFVLGYEIKLSGAHPFEDICDSMQGRYPKDFKFSGWHPNCMCYCIPILKTEEQFWADDVKADQVTEMPECFKDYVRDNQSKIKIAESNGTSPYWVRDNFSMVERAINPSDWKITEDDIVELKSLNFGRFDSKAYNRSAMRGFNLLRFDKGLEAIGDEHHIYWSEKSVHIWDNGNVTLKYKGLADSAKIPNVELQKHFHRTSRGLEVSHAMFDLPDELQGKGISKAVFRNLFREYGDMGVARINVRANMNVGGYCWAKYGFCTSKSEALNLSKQVFLEGRITQAEYDKAVAIIETIGSIESFPMNYLANAPFGKRMLKSKNVEWNGFLDFSDNMQSRYMKDYVGYPKKI